MLAYVPVAMAVIYAALTHAPAALLLLATRNAAGPTAGPDDKTPTTVQTVNVGLLEGGPRAGPPAAEPPLDAHTLPGMYALTLAAQLWLASGGVVQEGTVAAVAVVGALSTLFVCKLSRRFGSQHCGLLVVAALLLAAHTAALVQDRRPVG